MSVKINVSSVVINAALLATGLSGMYIVVNTMKIANKEQISLLTELSQNKEASLLKVIDDKMELPIETKVLLARTILQMSQVKKIPVHIICGLIDVETGRTWKHTMTSSAGATGLFQIMTVTAKPYLRSERMEPVTKSLLDPVTSSIVGISYLADCHSHAVEFGLTKEDDYRVALTMYNGGPRFKDPKSSYATSVMECSKQYIKIKQ